MFRRLTLRVLSMTVFDGEKAALVRVRDCVDGVFVRLPYSEADNFTGRRIYAFKDAYLRYGTALKLAKAQEYVRRRGAALLIWDAYRPAEAQRIMWSFMPDDDFVADPRKGFSNHTRGCAVDLTLASPEGRELVMPSAFDDFTGRAKRVYNGVPDEVLRNVSLLERAMEYAGFRPYVNEWWHFNDTDSYPVLAAPPFELE